MTDRTEIFIQHAVLMPYARWRDSIPSVVILSEARLGFFDIAQNDISRAQPNHEVARSGISDGFHTSRGLDSIQHVVLMIYSLR